MRDVYDVYGDNLIQKGRAYVAWLSMSKNEPCKELASYIDELITFCENKRSDTEFYHEELEETKKILRKLQKKNIKLKKEIARLKREEINSAVSVFGLENAVAKEENESE